MLFLLAAVAVAQVRETPVKPVIDGWAEPAVWSRAEPLLLTDSGTAWRAVWDRDALFLHVTADRGAIVELIVNTSSSKSVRIGHLHRRYWFRPDEDVFRGTTVREVVYAYGEIRLPWSALGGINGEIGLDISVNDKARWKGSMRLITASGPNVPVWRPAAATQNRPGTVVFADDFGPASRGELMRNILPGTGYPYGQRPVKWTQLDEKPWDDPRRGFWIIPESEELLVQAGRSDPSWLFTRTPIPAHATRYDIEFVQCRASSNLIGFILGASQPDTRHDGIEVLHRTSPPGSDRTTTNIYYQGALGDGIVVDQAFTGQWVPHRIEVRGKHVRWFQADRVIAEGHVQALRPGGFFGITHRGERDTRYDDVVIRVFGRGE